LARSVISSRAPSAEKRERSCTGYVAGNGGQLDSRALERDAGFEDTVRLDHAHRPIVHHHRRRAEGTRASRHPHVVVIGISRQRGQHADDMMDFVVHRERGADDGRVAVELIHPEAVAEDDDRRRANLVLARQERAAEERLHADHLEEPVGHDASLHAQRIAVPVQLERHTMVFGHSAHRPQLAIEVFHLDHRIARVVRLRRRLDQVNQTVAAADRQAME
jgi:hypothetical protein